MITYILDSNIVIKLWNQKPELFRLMKENKKFKYIIPKNIAEEIAVKERCRYKGTYILSQRFLDLISYIEDHKDIDIEDFINKNNIKVCENNKAYYFNDNKLSKNDLILISLANSTKNYIIVTEDKRILKASREILGYKKAITLEEFITIEGNIL